MASSRYFFLPPEPMWGDGPFVGPSDVAVLGRAVVDTPDVVQLAGLVSEVSVGIGVALGIGDDVRGVSLEDRVRSRKWPQSEIVDMGFTHAGVSAWWSRENSDSYLVVGNAGASLQVLKRVNADGRVSAFVRGSLHSSRGAASSALRREGSAGVERSVIDRVCAEVREVLRLGGPWTGGVALGHMWSLGRRLPGPIECYGPVVVAAESDLDLGSGFDEQLVSVEDWGDGRFAIASGEGVELVAAVTEIRRMVWPGVGLPPGQSLFHGQLYLDGAAIDVQDWRFGARKQIERMIGRSARGVARGEVADTVCADGSLVVELRADGNAERRFMDLVEFVRLWRRPASALVSREVRGDDGLIEATVERDGDVARISLGACHEEAIAGLKVLLTDEWHAGRMGYEEAVVRRER